MISFVDASSFATAVGVLVAAAGLVAQARARRFGLAQIYVQRYWELDDRLQSLEGSERDSLSYLRFCEDEYEIARLGWIDSAVWDVWHDGIVSWFFERILRIGHGGWA